MIRLTELEKQKPRRARIPYKRALGWLPAGEARSPIPIFMTQQAYIRVCAYAGMDLKNEVGGWLVGKWCADRRSGEQFIVIEAILPARYVQNGSAFLTFTQDSMVELYDRLQVECPGKQIVGWYHTHPRMGVFLSAWDTWLHSHFFPEAWQVALVIEPYSKSGGFFIQQPDGALDDRQYYGFYELMNREKRSVVHWTNLATAAAPGESEGGINL